MARTVVIVVVKSGHVFVLLSGMSDRTNVSATSSVRTKLMQARTSIV
jgi:hypothetical protein